MDMSMPDEFELPRPQDFCRSNFTTITERGIKHCFVGWQRELIPAEHIWVLTTGEDKKDLDRFFAAAMKVAKRMKLKAKHGECIFNYNDDTRNTPTQLAEWFEKTVKALGYDIK